MYQTSILGQKSSMADFFNVQLPDSSKQPAHASSEQEDISMGKFFDLVREVSNGDAPLLKYKDNQCIQNYIKT